MPTSRSSDEMRDGYTVTVQNIDWTRHTKSTLRAHFAKYGDLLEKPRRTRGTSGSAHRAHICFVRRESAEAACRPDGDHPRANGGCVHDIGSARTTVRPHDFQMKQRGASKKATDERKREKMAALLHERDELAEHLAHANRSIARRQATIARRDATIAQSSATIGTLRDLCAIRARSKRDAQTQCPEEEKKEAAVAPISFAYPPLFIHGFDLDGFKVPVPPRMFAYMHGRVPKPRQKAGQGDAQSSSVEAEKKEAKAPLNSITDNLLT